MSDPLRNDTRAHGAAVDALARDAKIDHLLLLGLEHYFQGEYDQAINVWTRVLFLDRTHARARAYIDRARGAVAERQRQAEEFAWSGLAPLSGFESVPSSVPLLPARAVPAERSAARRSSPGHSWIRTTAGAGVIILVAGATYVAYSTRLPPWLRPALPRSLSATSPRSAGHEVLPAPPSRGERALARARTLVASGDLRDALSALERVRTTDPQWADADRLRAEIQHQLLDLARR